MCIVFWKSCANKYLLHISNLLVKQGHSQHYRFLGLLETIEKESQINLSFSSKSTFSNITDGVVTQCTTFKISSQILHGMFRIIGSTAMVYVYSYQMEFLGKTGRKIPIHLNISRNAEGDACIWRVLPFPSNIGGSNTGSLKAQGGGWMFNINRGSRKRHSETEKWTFIQSIIRYY